MKRVVSLFLCGLMVVGCITGCGSNNGTDVSTGADTETASATEEENQASSEMVEVKIWHDGDESIMSTIADCVNQQLVKENVQVTFEKKTGLTEQLQLYSRDE